MTNNHKSLFKAGHRAAVGGMLAATALGAPLTRVEAKPNVIYILADDLGWKDVGFNGSDIKTPNIDKLATNGARMTQFYVQPMCTPTRASLMTGRYPFRTGLQTLVILSAGDYGLPTDEYLLPQALKDSGYNTAIIGKWHLGHADKKFWPQQRGFDYTYGPLIGELDYFTHEQHGVVDWYRDNKLVKEEGYTTHLLGDDAVKYINAQTADKPFFIYLTFNAPHTPYQAPQEYLDQYANIEDPSRRAYAGSITAMDDQIGRVVAALEEKGLRENTLIVFSSDNGGTNNAMFAGELDMSQVKIPCDNGPYRDGKGSLYEGGTRVCALANWPGHIMPGDVDGMIHIVDMYPTITALAGASTEQCKQPMDGMNVWSTISEGKPSPRTEVVYNVEPFRGAVRQGDWKLVWRTPLPAMLELFNIAEDPSETNNLAADHPDIVARLQQRTQALSLESAKPLTLVYMFKGIQEGTHRPPAMPSDVEFYEGDLP
ncbi:MAG: arylsulfatase [Phycisphaeraceae bacterium]|nr:arylsulfatase [Phycisphaeraceae bacterium]